MKYNWQRTPLQKHKSRFLSQSYYIRIIIINKINLFNILLAGKAVSKEAMVSRN